MLPSPLDALIDALGGAQEVAEMTGRRGRLVRARSGGRLKYELRAEHEETRCVRVRCVRVCVCVLWMNQPTLCVEKSTL